METDVEAERARALLRERFGFESFKPGQLEVITRLVAGRSCLAVFPTGGGKSLTYQLPALLLGGLTLVVSPLIALMKDQVDALERAGVAAARLDSTRSFEETLAIQDQLARGELALLYVAPERLANERFLARLRRLSIALLAIDEAHCISEWGHNFRPDYLKLARLARELGAGRVLALTATATPKVASDIRQAFDIATDDHIQTGFHRPNLHLNVTACLPEERLPRLVSLLAEPPRGPSIVYVTLQRTAEEVAAALTRSGQRAEPYHAGLPDERRSAVQDDFMAGRVDTVVATIAFGMGIDKSDIRRIVHFNLPKTLENYVQETGRAGRDGEPARCTLLASADDRVVLANFSYGDTPSRERVEALVAELLAAPRSDVSLYELSVEHDIRPLVVATALTYLELSGALEATGPFYSGYKLQFRRPRQELVQGFDADRRGFLERLFDAGRKGRTWLDVEPAAVALAIGEPRERIVAALGYLEERGDIELKASGLRYGYRRPGNPDRAAESGRIAELFARREQADIERLDTVLAYASGAGCLTARLLAYFGEELGDCGHCSACDGEPAGELPQTPRAPLGAPERELMRGLILERQRALASPRPLARFLCGLSSPAATKDRLGRHARFGALAGLPFPAVLALAEEAFGSHGQPGQ